MPYVLLERNEFFCLENVPEKVVAFCEKKNRLKKRSNMSSNIDKVYNQDESTERIFCPEREEYALAGELFGGWCGIHTIQQSAFGASSAIRALILCAASPFLLQNIFMHKRELGCANNVLIYRFLGPLNIFFFFFFFFFCVVVVFRVIRLAHTPATPDFCGVSGRVCRPRRPSTCASAGANFPLLAAAGAGVCGGGFTSMGRDRAPLASRVEAQAGSRTRAQRRGEAERYKQ